MAGLIIIECSHSPPIMRHSFPFPSTFTIYPTLFIQLHVYLYLGPQWGFNPLIGFPRGLQSTNMRTKTKSIYTIAPAGEI
jgi:hypothetical protein